MKLAYRLCLSYLAVVTIFCLVAVGIWIPFSLGPTYRIAREEVQQWVRQLLQEARKAHQQGGPDRVVEVLQGSLAPPDTELTLVTPSRSTPIWGNPIEPNPKLLEKALAGTQQLQMPPPFSGSSYKGILYVPLKDGRGQTDAVLVLALPARLPPEVRDLITHGLLLSVAGGATLALVLAMVMSFRIARPVEVLTRSVERLGQGDLSQRVEPGGDDELTELANNFNRMAESLQGTVVQLHRVEAAQRQFLADVSHNLRTPLSAILGWTEALQDGIVKGQEPQYLERIHSQTQAVTQKVARLLELSRWQSSEPLLTCRSVPLSEPLLEAVDAVAPAAEKTGSRLALTGDLKRAVWADPDRLRDVFQILLENAVEHGGPGISIEVRVEEGPPLAVVIEDNGQGQTAPSEEGRGLGLAIARRLIAAHGGVFQWESEPGRGTKARLELPLTDSLQSPGIS